MNTEENKKIILVADSHITGRNGDAERDFFAMLERISSIPAADVVFLGDIFELWVALDSNKISDSPKGRGSSSVMPRCSASGIG